MAATTLPLASLMVTLALVLAEPRCVRARPTQDGADALVTKTFHRTVPHAGELLRISIRLCANLDDQDRPVGDRRART